MSTNGVAVTTLSFAGILAASPLGINMETILICTAFCYLGVLSKVGFSISRAVDSPGGLQWGKIIGALAGSILAGPTIAVLCLLLLKMVGVQNDGVTGFSLIFAGFFGPEILPWFFNTLAGMVNKKFGLNIPLIGGKEAQS